MKNTNLKKYFLIALVSIFTSVNVLAECIETKSTYFQNREPGQLVCIKSLGDVQFDDENYNCKLSYSGVDASGTIYPVTTHFNYNCVIPRLSAEAKLGMTLGALFTFGMTTIAGGIDAYNNSKARDRIESRVKSKCEAFHENLQMMMCNN